MDFLDAQSDYRHVQLSYVQLSYVQLVGSYLTAAGQLNLAVGTEAISVGLNAGSELLDQPGSSWAGYEFARFH